MQHIEAKKIFNNKCEYNIYHPIENRHGFIKNPAMGWVIYIDAFGGFPKATEYWEEMDKYSQKASILYIRLPWAQMEAIEGRYSWVIDFNYRKLIEMALERNFKLAFRVYVDGKDSYVQATPKYVRDAGCEGYEINPGNGENNTFWTPYLCNKIFQNKFEIFISAFAKQYDNTDVVDYIDGGGLGWWGEMHNVDYLTPKQKEEIYSWITQLYSNNFRSVLLGDQYGKNSFPIHLHDKILSEGWIIRRDSFGSPVWFTQEDKEIIKSKWPKTPVFAENCYHTLSSRADWWGGDGFSTLQECLASVVSDAIECHANTLDLRIIEDAKAWNEHASDLIDSFANLCGYRFVLSEICFPKTIKTEESIVINHKWCNRGVGKLPNDNNQWNYKYKLAFTCIPEDDQKQKYIFVDEKIDISTWINGTELSFDTTINLADLKAGNHGVYVGIVDVTKNNLPQINLAIIADEIYEGWYKVGDITLVTSK